MNSGPRSKGFRSVRNLFSSAAAALLLERFLSLRGQPQLQDVPRRHRVLAAHHHDVPEDLLEQAGGLAAARGRAGEQAAQEPARPVDADEADQPQSGGGLPLLGGYLGDELSAERPLDLLSMPARGFYLPGDLGPDVIPQRGPPGRGERLDLHLAVAMPEVTQAPC